MDPTHLVFVTTTTTSTLATTTSTAAESSTLLAYNIYRELVTIIPGSVLTVFIVIYVIWLVRQRRRYLANQRMIAAQIPLANPRIQERPKSVVVRYLE